MRHLFLLLLFLHSVASCQPPDNNPLPAGESYDPPNSTDTRSKPIYFQKRSTIKLGDIYISNEFYGARLSNVRMDINKPNRLIATIEPENAPINQSSWYAFRIWSDTKQEVTIEMNFPEGKHRYYPKLSKDGENWSRIASHKFKHFRKDEISELTLEISPEPLWISGQELMTSKEIFSWMDSLEQFPFISGEVAGKSALDKPIRVLKIEETAENNVIILIGRQHPPEITGQIAMDAFIATILDSTLLANRFRKQFKVYAFPLANPDGVDQGHWRHNAGGVDLNRDWWHFRQPETAAISSYLKKELLNDSTRVWYGFDFHSTGADVLYPISNTIIPDETSITKPWIDNMKIRLPSDEWKIEPFDIDSPIAKNWIYRTFGAEAITYEVGDETSRSYVKLKAKIAAEEMMRILLARVQ